MTPQSSLILTHNMVNYFQHLACRVSTLCYIFKLSFYSKNYERYSTSKQTGMFWRNLYLQTPANVKQKNSVGDQRDQNKHAEVQYCHKRPGEVLS